MPGILFSGGPSSTSAHSAGRESKGGVWPCRQRSSYLTVFLSSCADELIPTESQWRAKALQGDLKHNRGQGERKINEQE